MSDEPNDPTTVVLTAAVTAAVNQGMGWLAKGAESAWAALREKLAALAGDRAGEVEEAIDDVVAKPDKKGRQDDLREVLGDLEPDGELVELARTLNDAFEREPKTQQIAREIRDSTVIQVGRDLNVGGDLVTGKKKTELTLSIAFIEQRYEASSTDAHAIRDYLTFAQQDWRRLPLGGIARDWSDAESLSSDPQLEEVYVGLDVTQPRPKPEIEEPLPDDAPPGAGFRDETPWSALEACADHRRLVILGDPGGGKSTFLRRLALRLAAEHADRREGAATPDLIFGESLLPVLVTLREFVEHEDVRAAVEAWSDRSKRKEVNAATLLTRFVAARCEHHEVAAAWPAIERHLRDGDAILMLDGLDEVTTAPQREVVLESIRAFARRHHHTRIIVTCRVASYPDEEAGRDPWLHADDFPVVTLAPFDDTQIHDFIDRWYDEQARRGRLTQNHRRLASSLRGALARSHIRRLAPNPLLLTLMAIVHGHGRGELPDYRVVLYDEAVRLLLVKWTQGQEPGDKGGPGGVAEVLDEIGLDVSDLEPRLDRLAWTVHARTPAGADDADAVAEITRNDLGDALTTLKQKTDPDREAWTGRLIDAMKFRSGLLLERADNVFVFPHRTFQEFLAARVLVRQHGKLRELRLTEHESLADELHALGSERLWRQVVLMVSGILTHLSGNNEQAAILLEGLLAAAEATDESWPAILAADFACESTVRKLDDAPRGAALVERLRGLLMDRGFGPAPPPTRASYASALGRLGDPRPGVTTLDVRSRDFWTSEIPAGRFRMGDGGEDHIRDPYALSRHPVTVAQFDRFVTAGGYEMDEHWSDEGRRWRDEERITGPWTFREVFQTPNHPQVGVSGYEADAFCAWLTALDDLPPLAIRLPTEAEWERAAAGDDGREYPWEADDAAVESRANVGIEIGSTTPVGLYPAGQSPTGALDMAGNVWEWCDTRPGSSGRVLRGGAWGDRPDYARCAYRDWNVPRNRGNVVGFRVCVSPFSHSGL